MAISFDGPTKTISLSSGTVTLSVRDLWSRWVDWVVQSDNSKYEIAMASLGGDPIDLSEGTFVPVYVFLQNGWRIKPQEANHTLNVGDGILLVEGGGDPFVNTSGSFVIRINYQQPVQAISFSSEGGGSGGATAAQIWQYIIENGKSAEEILRILVAVAAGDATGLNGNSAIAFRDLGDNKNRIEGTYSNGTREITTVDGS